jgi:hypothetical protein
VLCSEFDRAAFVDCCRFAGLALVVKPSQGAVIEQSSGLMGEQTPEFCVAGVTYGIARSDPHLLKW